jgi:peroxiredoxin
MTGLTAGARVPSFRLPSAQGPEVSLDDFRGRKNLILWFTKGMACPFCRQQMSQLARGYGQFKTLDAELLQITPSPLERARFYARKFPLPFPYLCDPDYSVRRAFGLESRSRSLVGYAKAFIAGGRHPKPATDLGQHDPSLGDFPLLLKDDDMGFFVTDRDAIVRYALAGSYGVTGGPSPTRPVPTNEEIVQVLRECGKPRAPGA